MDLNGRGLSSVPDAVTELSKLEKLLGWIKIT